MTEARIPYFRIVQALTTEPWAITEDMYSLILDRVLNHAETDVRALETQMGRPLDNTGNRVTMRGITAAFVELFCKTAYVTELPRFTGPKRVGMRVSWV